MAIKMNKTGVTLVELLIVVLIRSAVVVTATYEHEAEAQ